jgi:PhnB protein
MSKNKESYKYPSVIPMIAYENGLKAMTWLTKAFGFQAKEKWLAEDGTLTHGEMIAGDGLIMLATPTKDYQSPKHHSEVCQQAKKWFEVPYIIDGVVVYVDNIEDHFKNAKDCGARILSNIEEDSSGKRYRVEDLEGHRWFFFEKD